MPPQYGIIRDKNFITFIGINPGDWKSNLNKNTKTSQYDKEMIEAFLNNDFDAMVSSYEKVILSTEIGMVTNIFSNIFYGKDNNWNFINVAKCPFEKNNYTDEAFNNCFEYWTRDQLDYLNFNNTNGKVFIAIGDKVKNFLAASGHENLSLFKIKHPAYFKYKRITKEEQFEYYYDEAIRIKSLYDNFCG
jgi:hypothetical protein